MAKAHHILPVIDPDYSEVRRILEALDDAGEEMSYSNYHNRLFGYAQAIIRDWCKTYKVRLGPTIETLDRHQRERWEAEMAARAADNEVNADGIPLWLGKLLEERKVK